MAALARRAVDGGSYRVHVNLTRVAMWACTLGFFDWDYVRATVGTGGDHELIDPSCSPRSPRWGSTRASPRTSPCPAHRITT